MSTETILPDLIGTLAALPEHTQNTIQAYGDACYRTALQSPEVQAWKRDAEVFQLLVSKTLKARYNPALGQALVWDGLTGAETIESIENNNGDACSAMRKAIKRAAMEKQT